MSTFNSEIPDFVQQYITPKDFFGEEDAEIEWQQPENSASIFLHTDSYENFKEENCLYLFGRRGTGKTSIMRMFNHEVNKGLIPPYSVSIVLDQEDAYHELSMQLRGSPFGELPTDELIHFLVKKWEWVITTHAMAAIVNKRSNHGEIDDNVRILKNYLCNEGVCDITHNKCRPWNKIKSVVTKNLEDIGYETIKLGLAITKISSQILNPDFERAKQALYDTIAKYNEYCVVLIDSIELYNLYDHISSSVVTALIEAVRRFFAARNSRRILAKAAFPSEIYTFLTSLNQEKIEGKNLFILWRYRDLVCLIAKRHYKKFADSNDKLTQFDNFDKAKKYIYSVLPATVKTSQGMIFDTLAYIIRHTQKKPRQVILLFNIIYTLAENYDIDLSNIPKEFIKKGVHARLDILMKGTLDIYEQVYQFAERIVRRVLNHAPSHFTGAHLDSMLKEVSALRSDADLSSEDIKRLLLESGSIGIEYCTHNINEKINLVEAIFEYQVKGVLTISNDTKLVIHPMIYQEVHADVDMEKFVYPMPMEAEEKALLQDLGIKLQ